VLNLVNPIYYTKTINRKECIERLFTDKNVWKRIYFIKKKLLINF
jgi:hypothetical protein